MLKLAPIYDDALGEDIAWRIEWMEDSLGLLSAPNALPDFRAAPYAPAPNDDHDHCAGCWRKLMLNRGDEVLAFGFVAPGPGGQPLHWLCPDCHRILTDVKDGRTDPRPANSETT